jgi:hypothetical protein
MSDPVNLGPIINSAFRDNFGYLSADGRGPSSIPTVRMRAHVEGQISTSLRGRRRTLMTREKPAVSKLPGAHTGGQLNGH